VRLAALLGRRHRLLGGAGLGHDAVGKLSGNLFVVGELRVVRRAPLGEGAQMGRVLVELGLGNVGADDVVRPSFPMPRIFPRLMRSPVTAPTKSFGTFTSTSTIGSRRTGLASLAASLNAIDPAILKAISDESTV
jgi:hypothetical protein